MYSVEILKNAIDWTRANANSIWVAENISDVKTKGLEVEASQGFNSFIKKHIYRLYLSGQQS